MSACGRQNHSPAASAPLDGGQSGRHPQTHRQRGLQKGAWDASGSQADKEGLTHTAHRSQLSCRQRRASHRQRERERQTKMERCRDERGRCRDRERPSVRGEQRDRKRDSHGRRIREKAGRGVMGALRGLSWAPGLGLRIRKEGAASSPFSPSRVPTAPQLLEARGAKSGGDPGEGR